LKIYCRKLVASIIPHVFLSEKGHNILHDEVDSCFRLKLWNRVGEVFAHICMFLAETDCLFLSLFCLPIHISHFKIIIFLNSIDR